MKTSTITITLFLFSAFILFSQQEDKHIQVELYLLNRQYNEAIREAKQILSTDSLSSRANFNMGQAYIGLLKYPEALQVFQRADRLDPDNITILNAIGETWSALGSLQNAIDTYYRIIRLDSTGYYAYIQLGKLYQRQNDFLRAIPIYLYLCNVDPGNFYYYKQLGICYQKLDKHHESVYYLQKALEFNPRDITIYPTLANMYIREGNFTGAIELLSSGLEQDSTNQQIIKVKSYAHLLAHQSEPAIEGFRQLIEWGDSSLFVVKYLGLAYYEHEEYVNAVSYLEKTYFADTTNAENCYYYALALSSDYAKRKSIEFFLRSIELQEPNRSFIATIYKKIGENYRHVSEWEQSLKAYQMAFENDPYDHSVLFYIASLYDFNIKDKKKALEYYTLFMERVDKTDRTGESDNVITLAGAAERRIKTIREELHFKGELDK